MGCYRHVGKPIFIQYWHLKNRCMLFQGKKSDLRLSLQKLLLCSGDEGPEKKKGKTLYLCICKISVVCPLHQADVYTQLVRNILQALV